MPSKIDTKCKESHQPTPSSKNETIRVALEGLALKYRQVLENLRNQTGKSLQTLHIVGGGTQNELLNQMTADSTGCEVVAGPVEATSVGNVLVQMMATGEISSIAEGRQIVRDSFEPQKYAPHPSPAWDEAYEKMKSLSSSRT
jgi:rhamnulokinase